MSELSKKELDQIGKIGSVLIKKLTEDELRTLSLVHDCGELDNTMDKEVNPQVSIDFPEDFVDPDCGIDVPGIFKAEAKKVMKKLEEEEEDFVEKSVEVESDWPLKQRVGNPELKNALDSILEPEN